MLTVDANVFVSASTPTEIYHADSDSFLSRIRQSGFFVFCPALVLPETASGIMRPTGDQIAAQKAVIQVETFPNIALVPLTEQRANSAADIAILHRLRGADAVYVAVSQEFGTTLITWDAEMLARGTQAVTVMTPTDWLAANPTI